MAFTKLGFVFKPVPVNPAAVPAKELRILQLKMGLWTSVENSGKLVDTV